MDTMEQNKRVLCQYDDKRYLLAELVDGCPNPNPQAYGHCHQAAEEQVVADQPEPSAEFIIRHPKERIAYKHAHMTSRLKRASAMDMVEELPDGDADSELHSDQLLIPERVAAS